MLSKTTLEKKAPLKIMEFEAVYRILVENISVGIALLSRDMEILAVNKQMCDWFPNIKATKTMICYRDFRPSPAEEVCEYCPIRQTLIDGKSHEVIVDFPSNTEMTSSFKITSLPVVNIKNETICIIEMFQDYSSIRRLERILENESGLLKSIDKNDDYFIILDDKGVVLYTNPITEKLMNIQPGSLVGAALGCPASSHNITEIEILNPIMGIRNVQLRSIGIEWDQKPAQLVMLNDITDRLVKANQIALALDERKRADDNKNAFISTVSHELRTPMAIIQESISQVLDGLHGETTPSQREMLSMSIESISRLGRIVDNLLDISKIEAGRIQLTSEVIDIVSLFKEISSTFDDSARDKGLKFIKMFPDKRIAVYLDKDRITQVLINLLSNAIKFTNKGKIELVVEDKKETVECTVLDTGRGISEEDRHRIFGKFEQFGRTEGMGEKGTGLGLAISKQLIELHKGNIWHENNSGKGSRFSFSLPKYSVLDMIRKQVSMSLKEALEKGSSFSIGTFKIKNYDDAMQKLDTKNIEFSLTRIEQIVKKNLRRREDLVFRNEKAIIVFFPQTPKTNTLAVINRILLSTDEVVTETTMEKEVEIITQVAGFPEDSDTVEGLLAASGL